MRLSFVVLVAVLASLALPAHAQRFRDPEDGAFDMSRHLATATGFLPIPMIMTEPAVGYGAGLFGAWPRMFERPTRFLVEELPRRETSCLPSPAAPRSPVP